MRQFYCEHANCLKESIAVPDPWCDDCQKPTRWRTERWFKITRNDRRFLKSLRILAEEN